MPIKLIHDCKLLPSKRWKAGFTLLFEQGRRRVAVRCEDSDPDRTFSTEKRSQTQEPGFGGGLSARKTRRNRRRRHRVSAVQDAARFGFAMEYHLSAGV
jgi:hypothetical protein